MEHNASPAQSHVTLESKVAFLRQATSFPEPTYRVEALETHMSWVFLIDGYAYKLKKPVCHDSLDFRGLEARRFYCEEEVRLNRRLAPDVYLGVTPLTIDARGHLRLDADGQIIDWLIKMRRLPTRHMLDFAIKHGTANENDMRLVAIRLTSFYQACIPVPLDPALYRSRFQHDIARNQLEMSRPAYQLPDKQIHRVCQAQRTFLEHRPNLFDARVAAKKIVEGHGDLRPEHICLTPEIAIIDCLEFARDLRIVDPIDELAFLALECERLGVPALGSILLRIYGEISGDWPDPALVHFYQGYRASLRARIAIKHLDEEKFRYSAEWRRRAGDYLRLAESHQESISSVSDPAV